jgi:hypothetical protein
MNVVFIGLVPWHCPHLFCFNQAMSFHYKIDDVVKFMVIPKLLDVESEPPVIPANELMWVTEANHFYTLHKGTGVSVLRYQV